MNTTRHTLKLDVRTSIVVQPTKTGAGVRFSFVMFGADEASAILTPDQCHALITSIQIAREQARDALL